MEGKDILSDPGTYCYTPLSKQRNAYRSALAHFVPTIANKEPNSLSEGLFALPDRAQPQCLYFGPRGFIGCHKGYGAHVFRMIEIGEHSIHIRDYYEGNEAMRPLDSYQPPPFSAGYGKQNL